MVKIFFAYLIVSDHLEWTVTAFCGLCARHLEQYIVSGRKQINYWLIMLKQATDMGLGSLFTANLLRCGVFLLHVD